MIVTYEDDKTICNQEEILVSICITSFNRPEGLDTVLSCITKQSHKNLQIIISDDRSPNEDVKKVILSYAEKDKRIRYYIHENNLHYWRNLKFALDQSVGNFIMWCDDDDWYHHDYVRKCLSALLDNNLAICAFSHYVEVDQYYEKKNNYPNQAKLLKRLTSKNTTMRLLSYLFSFNGYGYCNIYYGLHRRETLKWFDPEKFGMTIDMDVGMKLVSMGALALVKEHLFKKNVDIPKEYLNSTDGEKKIISIKEDYRKTRLYLFSYLRQVINYYKILDTTHAIIVLIFSPIWIAIAMNINIVSSIKNKILSIKIYIR